VSSYRPLVVYFRDGINAMGNRMSVAAVSGIEGVPAVGEMEIVPEGVIMEASSGRNGPILVPWSQIECVRVERTDRLPDYVPPKDSKEEQVLKAAGKKTQRRVDPVLVGQDPGPMVELDRALGIDPRD